MSRIASRIARALHYTEGDPARLSRDIVLLNQAFSPLMNLLDAQTALINGGPEGVLADAVTHEFGAILASRDRVALDVVGAAMIKLGLEKTPVPRPDPVHHTLVSTSVWELPQITEGAALGLGLARGDVVDLITEGFEADAALRRILAT